jgi:hypothetical protein
LPAAMEERVSRQRRANGEERYEQGHRSDTFGYRCARVQSLRRPASPDLLPLRCRRAGKYAARVAARGWKGETRVGRAVEEA